MQTQNETNLPHVVIVGGGAGGLELATKLGKKLGKKNKARITLIDKNRVHIWKPLLHEVATGSLDTEIDGVVYRAHSARHSYHFQLGAVESIDRESKKLQLAQIIDESGDVIVDQRTLTYDTLVLAIGSISNDFGTPGIQQHCYMLDSRLQAQNFQKRLLNQFLHKSQQAQSLETITPTRLAIVGAGATGVELSAELNHVVDVVRIYDIDNNQGQPLNIDLIEAGHAYVADGHVLFSVSSYEDYGHLSKRAPEELLAGARVDVAAYKKEAGDFVLWKPSSDDQPGWDSPWGRGRPGWHIECSAMAATHLGETIDIHGGGHDLVFPHHENERAQSCCANGTDYVNYWMHNGFINIDK